MPKTNDCWGIEVGANALKAIRLVKKGEELSVADFAVQTFKKVLTTPDINADEQIQVALDEFLAAHPKLQQSTVVISAPGHAGFARFAKLPPVEPKKIPEIVKFEAMQQIPFPINDVEWDYQIFTQPDSPDVEVGIFAITNPKVDAHLANYRRVGLRPDGLTLSPIAVFNAITYDHDLDADAPGVVMVDIGTTSTDVIVHEGGKLWLRTLQIGGNNFTEALVKAFKLSFPKAEKLKREASTSKYARQIFTAMRPVFADFVQELQRSLGYYQSLNREARLDRLIGLGSTFRLPGLQKFLKQQLQIEVVRPDSFSKLTVEGKRQADFAEHTLNLATAYGCALQGLGLEAVSANLLPKEDVRERLWEAKKPWFIGAAAAFALPVLLVWGYVFSIRSGYDTATQETATLLNETQRGYNAFRNGVQEAQQQANLEQRIGLYRRMLDYRDVWPKLLLDISAGAAAVNPDPDDVVYSADYERLGQVPRPQRMRIYIDSITSDYRFSNEPTADDPQMIFDPPQDVQPAMMQSDMPGPGGGMAGPGAVMAPKLPPSFTVVVRGHVNDRASTYVSQFERWLRANADRPDRPYTLELSGTPYTIEMMAGSSRQPGGPTAPSPTGGGGRLPFGWQQPGATPTAGVAASEALPLRPLAEEERSLDRAFSMTITVKLRTPDEARQAAVRPSAAAPLEQSPDAEPQPAAADMEDES